MLVNPALTNKYLQVYCIKWNGNSSIYIIHRWKLIHVRVVGAVNLPSFWCIWQCNVIIIVVISVSICRDCIIRWHQDTVTVWWTSTHRRYHQIQHQTCQKCVQYTNLNKFHFESASHTFLSLNIQRAARQLLRKIQPLVRHLYINEIFNPILMINCRHPLMCKVGAFEVS